MPTTANGVDSEQSDATLREQLSAEFMLARMNRYRALIQLERRDSPENRDAARVAGLEIDAVLDMWNECGRDCE